MGSNIATRWRDQREDGLDFNSTDDRKNKRIEVLSVLKGYLPISHIYPMLVDEGWQLEVQQLVGISLSHRRL